ncbi:MAG: hypothetical protein RDU13_09045 [Elusimicrobiales bacterium]|nr:hypothetical protein [Elusimicrobiales bacterium]
MKDPFWKNAFSLPSHRPVTEEEKALLEKVAAKVRARSLGQVASLALESSRPLHNIGSQAVVFLMPFITILFKKEEAEKVVALLENPNAISYLIERLEPENPTAGEKNGEKNGK